MTKPITSVAVMMLVEEGRIDLHAPVATYLPELERADTIHSRRSGKENRSASRHHQLLTHTAGMTYGYFGNTPVDRMYSTGAASEQCQQRRDADQTRLLCHSCIHQEHAGITVSPIDVLGVLVERVIWTVFGRFLSRNEDLPFAK